MAHNSYVFFRPNITYLGQKEPIELQSFRFLSALVKVHQIRHAIFENTSQPLFKFCMADQYYEI